MASQNDDFDQFKLIIGVLTLTAFYTLLFMQTTIHPYFQSLLPFVQTTLKPLQENA